MYYIKWIKKEIWRVVIFDFWWESVCKSSLDFKDEFINLRNNLEN